MTDIQPHSYYWAVFNRFCLLFPGWCVLQVPVAGDQSAAVAGLLDKIRRPPECSKDSLILELRPVGAWTSDDLGCDTANWSRILWLAVNDIWEDPLMCLAQEYEVKPEDRNPPGAPWQLEGIKYAPDGACLGAKLGRSSTWPEKYTGLPVRLSRVFLEEGYDSGGAYWGDPPNLWCAWNDSVTLWSRATWPDEARDKFLDKHPAIVFES